MLEFIVKMKDLASGGLARLAQNAKASMGAVSNSVSSAVNNTNKLGDAFDKADRKASNFGRTLRGLVAGVGIMGILSQAMGQAANAQNQQIAFKVLTGSKASGDALYNNLVNMADRTPYESQDLGRSAKTLLGYGMDSKQVLPTLNMLGDIAAAADNPAESLQGLALAFGQVSAKGHLAGQEVLQMINVGFNPLKEISLMTGQSMDVLDKAMSKGAISADMVRQAFEHATGPGGKFHNMMVEQSQTLGGQWSTFMDAVHHKLRDLGTLLAPAAEKLMKFATALINGEGPALAIATAIGAVALAMSWASITTGTLSAATAVWNAVLAMNPIVLVIGLIAALIIWIVSLTKKYEGWGKSLNALWEVIKAFGQMAWIPFKVFGETAWYYVQMLWLKIKDFAESVVITFQKVGRAFELAKSFDFSGAKDALTENIQTGASKEIAALEKEHAANQASYVNQFADAQKRMTDNLGKIGLTKKADGSTSNSLTAAGVKSAGAGAAGIGKVDGGKSVAGGITGGGPRVINIHINKMIEALNIHADSVDKGLQNAEEKVQELLLRVLNSGASTQ